MTTNPNGAAHAAAPAARAKLVVSRRAGGGMEVRELSLDPTKPYAGRLVGWTRADVIGWVCSWRVTGQTESADVSTADEAEQRLRDVLGMPTRPELPCPYCGLDPETPLCCGGATAAEITAALDGLPEITFGGTR